MLKDYQEIFTAYFEKKHRVWGILCAIAFVLFWVGGVSLYFDISLPYISPEGVFGVMTFSMFLWIPPLILPIAMRLPPTYS